MSNKTNVSFDIDSENVRELLSHTISFALTRFSSNWSESLQKVSLAVENDTQVEVLKSLQDLMNNCQLLTQDLDGLLSLVGELKEPVTKSD